MSDYVCKSPVLVCGFTRPDLLANCLAHVRAVNPPRLYISIDGPRKKVKSDANLVEQCRQIARSVSWCSDVQLKIEPENLGCRRAMQSALDWFFEAEPEGIILEDDIEATPAFFSFCDTMLERYRNDSRIACINGWTPVPSLILQDSVGYATKYFLVWGWASWRKSWINSTRDAEKLKSLRGVRSALEHRSYADGISQYWFDRLRLIATNKYDTWDITFGLSLALDCKLSISPNKSLIRNIGFDNRSSRSFRLRGSLSQEDFEAGFYRDYSQGVVALDVDFDSEIEYLAFGFGEGANYWPRFKSKVYYYLNIIPFGKTAIKAINRFR